jgi:phosphatidylethanolamine-binding protein (PEBP) family uncharacterized protein
VTLSLVSAAFGADGEIPRRCTCAGDDVSPPLSWSGNPPGTREGRNSRHRTGYGGPCPPIGRHRCFHKLYAIDVELPDLALPDGTALERATKGHVLARAEPVGTRRKSGLA